MPDGVAAAFDERKASADWKCFEYVCPQFPECLHATGDCCGVGDFFEDRTLTAQDCFDQAERPYFTPRDTRFRYWQAR